MSTQEPPQHNSSGQLQEQEPARQSESGSGQIQENVQNVMEYAQREVEESREPEHRVSHKTRALIWIDLVGFAVFGLIAWLVALYPVWPIDVAITRELQESRSPFLDGLMSFVSYIGYQPILFMIVIGLTAVVFWVVRLRLEALLIVGLSAISTPLNGLIKFVVSRPRPTANLVEVIQVASGKSFPSGHVMSYMAFWGLLFSLVVILFKRNRWWNYVLLIVSAFFVVMVGPSRVYLGDHWASDVFAAYLIGSLLISLTLMLYLRLKRCGVLTPALRKRG